MSQHNSRTILSRPRTRIYDSNYSIGESYYKGALDRLDRKYSGRPLSPPPRHSAATEAAERHARIFAEDDLEDSRRRASKTIRDKHMFDSRGGLFSGSRSADYLENGVDEETASRLQRIRASKRVALVDDVDLESTSSNLRTDRMINRSEKILDSVGINEYSARKAAMEDEFGYKNRALKVSYDDESDNMTKWTPMEEREPSSAVAKIRQVRARIAASEDAAAENTQVSSAALRARQSRARIDDIDEEMAAMSEKQAARDRRVARLKALVAECESETVDDMGISSISISEKKEKKTVRF